ncbi:MAG: hypothetical protein P0Y56_07315 [Candidatus Andeanibacterium colombiense]|uniref:Sulfotransferase domain-containing protein n=1 Tax=Candidatus Andeanibacterium colombiense TaxID=3121345 RepID=A0AAJ5XB85_9SPHN|nr:MAG: hypothetical protein P0Y56_07315 [Sphingomonadaceae bacterium]
MQRINLKPDDLDEQNRRFAQRPLEQAVFLNSVPKSGSHLLRNILRMFVPVAQQYQDEFIQHAILQQHIAAFKSRAPLLSWGHLFFSDASAILTADCRKVLLVRDPYSWVLAKARFLLSDQFTGDLDHLKTDPVTPEQLINLVIFGIHRKNPGLHDSYMFNAVAWLGTGIHLVRYEELMAALGALDRPEGEGYFDGLLNACGLARPDDWKERIRIGSDRRRSGTARENLSLRSSHLPEELNDFQRRLVDAAYPGLRPLLGYE